MAGRGVNVGLFVAVLVGLVASGACGADDEGVTTIRFERVYEEPIFIGSRTIELKVTYGSDRELLIRTHVRQWMADAVGLSLDDQRLISMAAREFAAVAKQMILEGESLEPEVIYVLEPLENIGQRIAGHSSTTVEPGDVLEHVRATTHSLAQSPISAHAEADVVMPRPPSLIGGGRAESLPITAEAIRESLRVIRRDRLLTDDQVAEIERQLEAGVPPEEIVAIVSGWLGEG